MKDSGAWKPLVFGFFIFLFCGLYLLGIPTVIFLIVVALVFVLSIWIWKRYSEFEWNENETLPLTPLFAPNKYPDTLDGAEVEILSDNEIRIEFQSRYFNLWKDREGRVYYQEVDSKNRPVRTDSDYVTSNPVYPVETGNKELYEHLKRQFTK